MSFRDGLRALLREQQQVWREYSESRDPAAQAMREIEERLEAAQQRANSLEGTPYSEVVDTHLSAALHDYILRRIEYQHTIEMVGLSFTDADLNRASETNRAAGAACLDATAWLGALLGRAVRGAAVRLGEKGVEQFNAAMVAAYPKGNYSLVLASTEADADGLFTGGYEFVAGTAIAKFGFTPDAADELVLKIENIGPQEVLSNVSLDAAVLMKDGLEILGLSTRIKEGRSAQGAGRRDPIPEIVRHEVWRRDGGQCVECGSRARLEFDHIIPLSQGGSNTARNLELRCESCNRRKGATI